MWRQSFVVSAYIATLPYVTLSCNILSCHVRYCLRVPVKLMVYGCQLSYRKFYVFFFFFFFFFLQCMPRYSTTAPLQRGAIVGLLERLGYDAESH